MKVIYIDLLIFVNLIVNYFILLATKKICKKKTKTSRLILADIVASACSLVIFLPDRGAVFSIFLRLIISSAVVSVAFGFKGWRSFFGLLGGFFSVSFAYAGICFGIWTVFKPSGMVIKNDVVYFEVSPLLLVFSSAVCYIILRLLKKHFEKNELSTLEYNVTLVYLHSKISVDGFLDTGNRLYDSFSESPVMIIKREAAQRLLGTEDIIDKWPETLSGFRFIPYSVVGGKGILPAFRPDEVIISTKSSRRRLKGCLLAVSNDLSGEYDVIFGANIFERTEKNDKAVETVDI